MNFHAATCAVIILPEHLAARAGSVEVLASQDDEIGGCWFFSSWRREGETFITGEPLRCWTPREEEEAEALARKALAAQVVDTVAIIDAADDRNETRRRERRQVVTNWRPRHVNRWQRRMA